MRNMGLPQNQNQGYTLRYKDTTKIDGKAIVRFKGERQYRIQLEEKRCFHTLYSVRDASEIFGISKDQIRLQTRQGKLTAINIGGNSFYTQTELISYAKRRAVEIEKEKKVSAKSKAKNKKQPKPKPSHL